MEYWGPGPTKMTQTKVQFRKKVPYISVQHELLQPQPALEGQYAPPKFAKKFARIRFLRGKVRIAGHFVHVEYIWLAAVEWLLSLLVYSVMDSLLNGVEVLTLLTVESAVFATLVLLSMTAMGMYDTRQRNRPMDVLMHVIIATAFCVAAMVMLKVTFGDAAWTYSNMALGALVLATGLMVTRLVFERYVDGQLLRRNILVLGIGKRARRIEQLRRKSDRRGFNLVGFLPSKGCQHCYISSEKLIKLNSICDYALSNQVDEIVIALDDRRQGLPITDLLDCRMSGIEVTEDLDFFEREASVVQLDLIQSGWLIRSKGFTNNSLSHFLKRTLDVVVSAVLSLCFLPVLLLTAIAIKIECGWSAPIFYTQRRVGRGGLEFTIYKLRSMSQNAEADGVAQWAKADDSRVTRVGTFIRKYRIDEIPQIWNVLLGDMSLVGPRPERKEFVGSLSELSEYYSHRHRVAPGLTGWAQLCYPYGASDKDAMEKLKYDLYYIKNHGLFLDIYILMQTVEVVLFKKGAR